MAWGLSLAACLVRCTAAVTLTPMPMPMPLPMSTSTLTLTLLEQFSNLSFGQHNAKSVNKRTRFETDAPTSKPHTAYSLLSQFQFQFERQLKFPAPRSSANDLESLRSASNKCDSQHVGLCRLKVKFTE